MGRKKKDCCGKKAGDIPAWFMTYSDVITLLMTFFILLLTFSTNEPEFFSKVKVVAFGGGGSSGVAGKAELALDMDSPVLRYRAPYTRIGVRGSLLPPSETDPARSTLDKGLKSLEESDALVDAERIRIRSPMSLLRDSEGLPTDWAKVQLKMLAQQLKSMPVELGFRVGNAEDAEFCINLALAMVNEFNVPLGRVSVATVEPSALERGFLEMIVTRTDLNPSR